MSEQFILSSFVSYNLSNDNIDDDDDIAMRVN